jgi:hypothetical protein
MNLMILLIVIGYTVPLIGPIKKKTLFKYLSCIPLSKNGIVMNILSYKYCILYMKITAVIL